MKNENYIYSFQTPRSAQEVFQLLLDIDQWWSGLYNEDIKGKSRKLNDEFTFKAGDGMHYSKQRLVELIADERIVWLVTGSKLSFLEDPAEWDDTRLRFDIKPGKAATTVTFTHEGLVPQIECYGNCSSAWTGYMRNLEKALSK